MILLECFDVGETCPGLIGLEKPTDLFDFFEHIGTAEADFFISSAGTESIGIKRHIDVKIYGKR
jgi:hypothetical protein